MQLVAALAGAKATAGLGVRAYVVRAVMRGERSDAADELLARLLASKEGRERALGAFGRVTLGMADAAALLDDADPRVRRAVAMASLARPAKATSRALLEHAARERDDATRQVLATGLLGGNPDGLLTTTVLADRAESGGADAALSAAALARRAEEANERKVDQLLASKDPVLRAHAARGLAFATLPDASGRLAAAYAYETDVMVRRAILGALSARLQDASAPARRSTLETAASLNPDGPGAPGGAPRPGRLGITVRRPRSRPRPSGCGSRWTAAQRPGTSSWIPRALRRDRGADRVRRRRICHRPWGAARRSPARACAAAAFVQGSCTMSEKQPPPSFEDGIKRLSDIVQTLERGDLPLEESLRLFEEGVTLSRASQERLDSAQKRVEELLGFERDGRPRTKDFEVRGERERDE